MPDSCNLNANMIFNYLESYARVVGINFERVSEHIPLNRIRPIMSRTRQLQDYRKLIFVKLIEKLTENYEVLQSQPQ